MIDNNYLYYYKNKLEPKDNLNERPYFKEVQTTLLTFSLWRRFNFKKPELADFLDLLFNAADGDAACQQLNQVATDETSSESLQCL